MSLGGRVSKADATSNTFGDETGSMNAGAGIECHFSPVNWVGVMLGAAVAKTDLALVRMLRSQPLLTICEAVGRPAAILSASSRAMVASIPLRSVRPWGLSRVGMVSATCRNRSCATA